MVDVTFHCIVDYIHVVWLTALVLTRDVYLVFSGFRVRWVTLPPPKTFKRYFDFSHPTASVQPSLISKVSSADCLTLSVSLFLCDSMLELFSLSHFSS